MGTNGIESYLSGSPLLAVAAAFAGGFLASLSPCVYPMIPIVSAFVGSRDNKEKSRTRPFKLSLGYVFGMAAVYALLGMIASLTGSLFGRIASSPLALLVVANLLMLLGLNTLEVLPFPVLGWGRSRDPAATGMLGAVLVGAASALVASPCLSPVLLGLLTYVATRQSVWYGGSLLFAFSLGMGVLLVAAGAFSGLVARLPRPGPWMVGIKKFLGILMLALAEYYLVKAGQAWL
jgi:thiol:disulfide interchange protein